MKRITARDQRRTTDAPHPLGRGTVHPLTPRSLTEANPGYRDIAEILRLFAVGAPVHIAAHWIDGATKSPGRDYSCEHLHDDLVEINVLLGDPGGLSYEVVLGADEPPTVVEAPCAIVVPAGVPHAANVLEGRGWFVVLRIPSKGGANAVGGAGS